MLPPGLNACFDDSPCVENVLVNTSGRAWQLIPAVMIAATVLQVRHCSVS